MESSRLLRQKVSRNLRVSACARPKWRSLRKMMVQLARDESTRMISTPLTTGPPCVTSST